MGPPGSGDQSDRTGKKLKSLHDNILVSMTKRAHKYRFYPTIEQEKLLAQTFGCVRFVYNHFTFYPSIIDFSVNLTGGGHGVMDID